MKTICIISSSHGRNDIRLFQKHTQTLSANGYKVIYVINDGKEDECKDNIRITTLGLPKAGKLKRLFRLSSVLLPKLIDIDADLYQICDPELIGLGRKLKIAEKNVIFDSVEDWEGYVRGMFPNPIGFLMSKIVTYALARNLKHYDRVLVMSPNIQKRLDRYAPSKVDIVSNYPIVAGHPSNGVQKESYINNDNQFIYCGSVYGFSVQEEVASSLKEIGEPNSRLLVVGSISEKRQISILSEGGEYSKFVSWVSKSELLDYYQKSLCGLVIFKYSPVCCGKEGQMGSNKIFEYMLEGLPIICTDFELWKKLIVDKYKCGICVNPDSKEEIKNAVRYMIEHRAEAFEMGQRGRNAVLTEFNWEAQAQKYLDIIAQLS